MKKAIRFAMVAVGLLNFQPLSSQAQEAPAAVELPFSELPFDLKTASVPLRFKGHDFQAIHKSLSTALTKGEFETTAAFQNRVALAAKNSLYGQIYASSLVTFVFDLKQEGNFSPWSYDADEQMMKIESYFQDAPYIFPRSAKSERIKSDSRVTGTYTAQNAFGAKIDVTQYEVDAWDLIILGLDKFSLGKDATDGVKLEFSTKMEATIAQRVKENLDVLIIGRLDKPYVDELLDVVTPNLNRPSSSNIKKHGVIMRAEEIWLYDSTTGEVFNKLQPIK